MTAAAGTDPKMWRDGIGIFTPATPMASNAGHGGHHRPKRDLPTLKKALRDAGYQRGAHRLHGAKRSGRADRAGCGRAGPAAEAWV